MSESGLFWVGGTLFWWVGMSRGIWGIILGGWGRWVNILGGSGWVAMNGGG